MYLKNLTNQSMDFVTGTKNGEAVTESLKAGEARDIDVRADDPTLKAREHVGAVSIGKAKASQTARTAASAEKPAS